MVCSWAVHHCTQRAARRLQLVGTVRTAVAMTQLPVLRVTCVWGALGSYASCVLRLC